MLCKRVVPAAVFCAGLVLLAACSPTLNWREVRLQTGGLVALFPCKPQRQAREVVLAGAPVGMQVLVCSADGVSWGLASADAGEPQRVGPVLAALREARARNLDGRETVSGPALIKHMTPHPQAARVQITGRLPDGATVQEESMFFVSGNRVFHAAALGGVLEADTVATFFEGLRLQPSDVAVGGRPASGAR